MITFWLGWILFAGVGMWAVMPTFWFVLRRLKPVEADGARVWPRVSIIVPACNEEGAVESSLRSLLALEYPNYEVIAVNDRSTDATGAIMDQVAADSEHCRVVHVSELPEGWLGKNHAMHLASTEATGDLLLFSDGDVIHEPAALRSAVDFAERKKLQHLCLLPRMIPGSYFEDSLVAFFGFAFAIGQQVHLIGTSIPFAYAGVGAFNLIRADFYRSFGGHKPLAMDVIDDARLGRLVKRNGGRQDFLGAPSLLSLRWYDSLWNVITGLEKNGFASLNYSLVSVFGCTVLFFATMIFPYFAIPVLGWSSAAGFTATVLLWHFLYTIVTLSFGGRLTLAPMFPIAASLMSFAFWRSAWITLTHRGVRWRTTFYALDDLRNGQNR